MNIYSSAQTIVVTLHMKKIKKMLLVGCRGHVVGWSVVEALWWVVISSKIMPLRGPICKLEPAISKQSWTPSWARVWQKLIKF